MSRRCPWPIGAEVKVDGADGPPWTGIIHGYSVNGVLVRRGTVVVRVAQWRITRA